MEQYVEQYAEREMQMVLKHVIRCIIDLSTDNRKSSFETVLRFHFFLLIWEECERWTTDFSLKVSYNNITGNGKKFGGYTNVF